MLVLLQCNSGLNPLDCGDSESLASFEVLGLELAKHDVEEIIFIGQINELGGLRLLRYELYVLVTSPEDGLWLADHVQLAQPGNVELPVCLSPIQVLEQFKQTCVWYVTVSTSHRLVGEGLLVR